MVTEEEARAAGVTADSLSLAAEITRLIKIAGPMPVARYMELCLQHQEHGYYMTRDPFGAGGDFTTAPEISQMFGELIGLWAAAVWRQMGSPENVRLVELGPGRGTLMRDALRATKVVPEFRQAVVAHLVEISPSLKARQRESLADVDIPLLWHDSLAEVPDGPMIVIANEFFDALPAHQAVKQLDGWHERTVTMDEDNALVFSTAPETIPGFERLLPLSVRTAPDGAIFEWRPDAMALEVSRRVLKGGGAALIIDYGHAKSAAGDTLQAVGSHSFASPLSAPGAVDLTAHVDFEALGNVADSLGAAVYGLIEQGEFLRRLGIVERAAALKKAASPDKAAEIDAALERLTAMDKTGMGRLFKVMALGDRTLGPLPGFET